MYAEIAVNAPVHATFDYHVPPELEKRLQVGHLVQVSFATAQQHGIVVGFKDHTTIQSTKPITAILDPAVIITPTQVALARWMSERYLAPLGLCVWLMLPPGLTNGRDIRITLLDDQAQSGDLTEQLILDVLRRRGVPQTGRRLEIAKALQGQHWRPAIDRLAKEGVIQVERILRPAKVRPRSIQTAVLAIHPNQIVEIAPELGKESRRADLLEALARMPDAEPTLSDALDWAGVATEGPANKLVEAGLIHIDRTNRPATVRLAIPREQVGAELMKLRGAEKLLHVLRVLARQAEPVDISWVYAQTGTNLQDLKRLEADDWIALGEKPTWRDSLAERDFIPSTAPVLTPEQAAAWEVIAQGMQQEHEWGSRPQAGFYLLHGVTGSGKTEIYLRAIEQTLAQGRQAIYLVPEIALTAQTIRRVGARFPGRVAIVHSRLAEGERYDTWRRARQGMIDVVVGARSALFTPLPNVGLVILDEEHDPSYKDSDGVPGYHAREVAEQMIRQQGGTLILGSATPDVETVYRARRGDLRLLELPNRILGHRVRILEQGERTGVNPRYHREHAPDALGLDLPPVQIIDMRTELKQGNTNIFSRALHTALEETLQRREQAILFINRRGQATYVFCRDCGYVAHCPNCDTPLTFHRESVALRCHRCGHQTPQPTVCPNCQSRRVKYFGAGTQQVEQALGALFPTVRTLRWDADTATKAETHDLYLQRFIDRKADVLVGTQMVAKGLDIPLVTLVGVVSADMGLNLPDFRAGERSFQILTQVAGRAGRGLLGGRVLLQTYQPEHYAVQAAAEHDFQGFYNQEMHFRRELGYPPFRRLARLVYADSGETAAHAAADTLIAMLRTRIHQLRLTSTELIGPAPCFFSRVNTLYRWQILLRSPDPTLLLRGFDLPRGWHLDLDPVDVL
jgi:primosomal protein N' (replication factor Y)